MAKLKRVPIPLDQRLDDLRRGPLAVLLWGAAALGAWTLLTNQGQEVRLIGLATSVEAEVSAAVDGRIAEVLVAPFEDVLAGQVIARLDDAALGARMPVNLDNNTCMVADGCPYSHWVRQITT